MKRRGGSPLYELVLWMVAWPQLSVCLMLVAVLLSALGTVYSAHETRRMYAQLQEIEKGVDYLDSEYEKLLLEQGAWANYPRVDQVSTRDLGMSKPGADDIVVVTR